MFKKRATTTTASANNNDNNNDDDTSTSPTITVSVPHDVFDVQSSSSSSTTRKSGEDRQWNRNTISSSSRSSYERTSPFLPQQQQQGGAGVGSRAWNPNQQQLQQQLQLGNSPDSGSGMSAGGTPVTGATNTTTGATGPGTTTTSPSLSTHSSSSSSAFAASAGSKSKNSPARGMMLNLNGIFSGTNTNNSTANGTTITTTTQTTTQTTASASGSGSQPQSTATGTAATAVEAQLWNADWVEPASPALPRYINAIAGKGAGAGGFNPRAGGGGGGGGGRLNSGWGSSAGGGTGMGRKSGEAAGWKTTSTTTAAHSPSFDRRSSESFRSQGAGTGAGAGAGYVPNNANVNPMLSQQQHHQQSTVSPSLRRNQPLQPTGEDGTGAPSIEMSWTNGGKGRSFNYTSNEDDDDEDDNYKDNNKKDRSFYTRRGHSQPGKSHFPLLFSDPKRILRARLFCLRQNRRLHPVVRLIVFLFLAGSVCFTTIHLLFLGTKPGGPGGLVKAAELRKSFDLTEQQLRMRRMLGRASKGANRVLSSFDVEAQNYSIHQWSVDTYDIRNTKAIARVGEDYMLSKAFNGAMHPTRVIPFYFKASYRDDDDDDDDNQHMDDHLGAQGSSSDTGSDSSRTGPGSQEPVKLDPSLITITTLITPNRYGVFLKLVQQYRGPISVATHIRKGPEQDAMFHELHAFFRDNAILRKYVDLHVIVDGVDFQLNMWRNVARMFARTDYFMMLDVDFHIPSSLKKNLHYDPRIQQLLASGAALVVPAFEYKADQDPKDSKYFPETKAELLPLLEKGHIHVFHDSFPPGHGATDTPRWIKMSQGISGRTDRGRVPPPKGRAGFEEDYVIPAAVADADDDEASADELLSIREEYLEHEADGERPYKVTKFEPKYEPYVILKKEGTPWCDERFVGYGANKAACLFEIYISGIDFWVMPEDFLIHQYHDYPTTDRKNGRILNRQLFVSFQQEVCFRTLDRMIVTGEWYTSKADNLRHQCRDFEGFLQSADQLAREFEERHPGSLLKDPVFVTDAEEADASRPRLRGGVGSGAGAGAGAANHRRPGNSAGDPQEQVDEDEQENKHSHEHGSKITLGTQLVDDEQFQDPWMSRPQGKIWGGVQPRTYYIPPPPEEEEQEIPIDGIGLEAALEGTSVEDHDNSPFSFEEAERANSDPNANNGDDLTGERLERFREGIILNPAHNQNHDQVAPGQQGPSSDYEDEDGEAAADADGSVADNIGDINNQSPSEQHRPASPPRGQGGSFKDEAEKLEQKFRLLPRRK